MFGKLFDLFSVNRKKKALPKKQTIYGIDGETYIDVLNDFNSTFMDFHVYVNKIFKDNLIDGAGVGRPRENHRTVANFYRVTKELVLFQEGLVKLLEERFNILLKEDFLLYASNRSYILHEKKLSLRQIFESGYLRYDRSEENARDFWWKLTHVGIRGNNGTGHYDLWMKLIADLLGMIEIYIFHSGTKKKVYSEIANELKKEIFKIDRDALSNVIKIIRFYDAVKFPVPAVLEPAYVGFTPFRKLDIPFPEDGYLTDVLVFTAIAFSGGYSLGNYTNYSGYRNRRMDFINEMEKQIESINRHFFKEY